MALRLTTSSPEDTQKVGAFIGNRAQKGDVYLLSGDLGAGKTCFTQGIASGLDVQGHARSPSFVIATRYRGRLTLHHIDLYRIQDPLEAWDLGLEELLGGDGVCVVEWAERATDLFPPECLWVQMDYGEQEGQRTITFPRPVDHRYIPLLQALKQWFTAVNG